TSLGPPGYHHVVLLVGVAWAFGALWFDFPIPALGPPLAGAFGLGAIAAFVFLRPRWAAAGHSCGRDRARDRLGADDPSVQYARLAAIVAETPYVEFNGDRVVVHNFRNFDYFSKTDFRPRWETKTVRLSHLRTVDFFTNFWGPKFIC